MAASRVEAVLAQLQDEVSNCEKSLLKLIQVKKIMVENAPLSTKVTTQQQQSHIAIIGMASIFPQSKNLQEYWEKIVQKVDCITDVPPSRWSIEDYYDPNPRTPDKTYCKRGGFIPEIDFNPLEFGLPPNILEVTDISQLLGLVVAKAAIEDAGYGESRQFNRQRTGVILGAATGRQLAVPLGARLQYPVWEKVLKSSGLSDEDTQKIVEKIKSAYVQWEENAFPGMLANVVAGRIANRLDLGGTNCVVDAACASSLSALKMAVSELTEHRADMMLTGGVDTDNSIFAYMCFSKTPAVSPGENVKPFDAESDGMMMGEGVGMLVLKRLEDAERDNDRIYAVIKGIGTSSDGRYKSIYAPSSEGQVKALHRAYEDAGFSPASVSLVEAHGTGTMVGDPTEFLSIKEVFGENNPRKQYIALGTVKSQIGHTKAAAGAASLIKTALALHHKVLPPTINITKPHPKLKIDSSPFYLNTETRPWIHTDDQPRRAGVSSFGFGGTNYHVVLEEYKSSRPVSPKEKGSLSKTAVASSYRLHNSSQQVLLFAPTPEQLLSRAQEVQLQLQSDTGKRNYAELVSACKSLEIPVANARVGFVANSLAQACDLLQTSIDWLTNKLQAESWEHPQGIYYRKTGMTTKGKVVALFSGQGSQYLEMGREILINFPDLQQIYAEMDSLLRQDGLHPLSEVVFPAPVFDSNQKAAQLERLQLTEYAQPAIAAFSVGLYKLLQQAGFAPDFVAGHSFGELTALWAAGVLSEEDYFFLVKARGQAMAAPNPQFDAGAMLAVKGDVSQVTELIKNFPQVTIANLNSHHQLVLAGTKAEIAKVQEVLKTQGFSTVLLGVSAAFHTPLVAHAQKPFAKAIEKVVFKQPQIPVYTNVTGKPYPSDPQVIQKVLKEHLRNQVLFKQEIENIYAEGGSCFIEFGPRSILTSLVKDILSDRPHIAVALNANSSKDSDRTLREAVVQLRVAGLPLLNFDPYQLESQISEVSPNQLLNVRLDSTNYVSEKTKQSFEKALQNGHQVKLPVSNGKKPTILIEDIATDFLTTPNPTMEILSQSPRLLADNGSGSSTRWLTNQLEPIKSKAVNGGAKSVNNEQSEELDINPPQPSSENSQRAIDSLEYTLIEFNRHQRSVLQVHEQSLKHQTEYTKTFFQLMQQQQSLWGNGKFTEQQAQTQQLALSSSERNIMRFHDHQAETLRVHEEYLNYQQEYTKNFFQLLQKQYEQQLLGNVTNYHAVSAPPLLPEDQSVLVVESNDFNTNSERISTNGDGAKPVQDNQTAIATAAPVPTTINQATLSQTLLNVSNSELVSTNDDGTNHQAKPVHNQTAIATFAPVPTTIDPATLSQTLLNVISDKTGYPIEMLEMDMDMEADLGIDSIKRVEILGALQEMYPDLPKGNVEELGELRTIAQVVEYLQSRTSPIVSLEVQNLAANELDEESTKSPVNEIVTFNTETEIAITNDADLSQALLTITSDKTGYPVEMLELDMDMEADLGIDSIKRVEILGAMQEMYPNLPKPNVEDLGELRTIGQIVDYLQQLVGGEKKKSEHEFEQPPQIIQNIPRCPVKLKTLPPSDYLDFSLPEGYVGLITDDGSLTTSKLAHSLIEQGWKVVVLSFPQSLIPQRSPLTEGVTRVTLENLSEEHLQQQLTAIATHYGAIGAFIHLHPVFTTNHTGTVPYLEPEKAIVKHVFLIAKHLKQSLNEAARYGRSCFCTVAHLDGAFGLEYKVNFGAIGAGLFGLTKTLRWEWPKVFTRAIDLSPNLDPKQSAQHILAELHDPNLYISEVAYGSQGRVTLVADNNIVISH
ncbi:acyltransferase domain-containing protein [Komarekiella sp. 'clone 1']|uniref:Acyltransferase domain-containing protein n=1 Tax=Komarekiella delphini-convector SJRDD-AB1 TaxID=2593771 RepID=A0AA40SYX8_9NOST|nr:type I polyketide synthase [Komarekiella delphini-convector]MBD6617883.1 acyltransferase domain-containing protein [Komarekiella delphini-convector SJRDD-AB1]